MYWVFRIIFFIRRVRWGVCTAMGRIPKPVIGPAPRPPKILPHRLEVCDPLENYTPVAEDPFYPQINSQINRQLVEVERYLAVVDPTRHQIQFEKLLTIRNDLFAISEKAHSMKRDRQDKEDDLLAVEKKIAKAEAKLGMVRSYICPNSLVPMSEEYARDQGYKIPEPGTSVGSSEVWDNVDGAENRMYLLAGLIAPKRR